MKKQNGLWIVAGLCAVLGLSLFSCSVTENASTEEQASTWTGFVPSPEFSPPYPPLPHHFNDMHGIQILCRAPEGAIGRALSKPLERNGDGDLFVLQMGWSPDCEGFNVHEIQINAPVPR
ncbi:MAG: hypothetical protein P8Z37_14300 [Acidobacteriota bacterium]